MIALLLFAGFLLLAAIILATHIVQRKSRDILVVRGFDGIGPDRQRALNSAHDMREAYRRAKLPIPVILNAPEHIRVERIKTI